MPPQSAGAEPLAGLIEIKRIVELQRNLVARLELLFRIRERHERMGRELEVNMILIAEMFHPMHLGDWPRTIRGGDPDMLGAQAHGSCVRRHGVAGQKLGGNEIDGGGAKPARGISVVGALLNLPWRSQLHYGGLADH